MDISSTRLTSLLKQALTPQPVPSAKADPATTALVKALVQPPAPSAASSAQLAAQALNGSLARPPAHPTQHLSSDQIEDAYRAVIEPDADLSPAGVPAGRPAAEAEQGPRRLTSLQPPIANSMARTTASPPLPVSTIAVSSSVLVAANSNAPRPRGAAVRPGNARSSEPTQLPLWMMSILTALLSATITTIALLLLS
ncbi:hypothetical protein EN745_31575 [Mesorhizobium sp. M4A.F.Ca.ET.022.05.2.1]|uniref:hypothetical protein n=1 Tax=Mesorhizobium sp. M4A.F.Ca.ET.022.05.2.1 TaxID=2496653 RepID=UPI000FCAAE65|nr:hypothetical protein [Mesorhizobium sp. M4A.F.Ca.ET.022.05.2.1]RVC73846.1 hypothetical protein EN745_31575 [Mesorhizobium sp. M4A.F.Ca.ET.022.05.2.1]